jgi:hypothetical protein
VIRRGKIALSLLTFELGLTSVVMSLSTQTKEKSLCLLHFLFWTSSLLKLFYSSNWIKQNSYINKKSRVWASGTAGSGHSEGI